MSTQIDIIRKRREPGQGSWVRIEGIGKVSTLTLEPPTGSTHEALISRGSKAQTQHRTAKTMFPLAKFARTNELETNAKVQRLFAGFLFLACDGLGDPPCEDTVFRFCARIFLEITPIDIPNIITVYKTVIIFPKEGSCFVILPRLLSDRWRYHSCYCLSRIPVHDELRGEVGL